MTPEQARTVLDRTCDGKMAYSPSTAREVAEIASAREGSTLLPYRCPVCSAFHIGHPPGMRSLAEIADAMRSLSGCAAEPARLDRKSVV